MLEVCGEICDCWLFVVVDCDYVVYVEFDVYVD